MEAKDAIDEEERENLRGEKNPKKSGSENRWRWHGFDRPMRVHRSFDRRDLGGVEVT